MTRSGAVILVCLLLASGPALPAAGVPSPADSGLDEVVVRGSRNELNRLRNKAVALEDQFYARFNELNTVDDFDTFCHQEARVGTKLKRRYCRAVYQDKALLTEAQDYTLALLREASIPPQPMAPPTPAYVAMLVRLEEYQENMRKVVREHPELLELARKRYEAEKQYDSAKRRIFGQAGEPDK